MSSNSETLGYLITSNNPALKQKFIVVEEMKNSVSGEDEEPEMIVWIGGVFESVGCWAADSKFANYS